ncbi:MAG: hypothetical protein IRY94_02200 [Rhodospirillaceae bacterium]|nr:hypothetical protein [Rhodospirillaceae bacterium]
MNGTYLLVCEDDAGREHVLHIHSRGSNIRLMELHADLLKHGLRVRIFQPVDWSVVEPESGAGEPVPA